MRVLGRFVTARTIEAPANPAGIKTWTEAWIQSQELGGKLIPVWIPDDVGADWVENQDVEARCYFYKLYTYKPRYRKAMKKWDENGNMRRVEVDMVIAPVFVAARLDPYQRVEYESTTVVMWVFLGGVIALVLLFVWIALRDRARSKKFEEDRVARRRRQRARRTTPDGTLIEWVMRTLRCAPAGAPPTSVRIGRNLRDDLEAELSRDPRPRAWIVDERLPDVARYGRDASVRHAVAAGEPLKSLAAVEHALRAMVRAGLDRGSEVVALGGGTVGDFAGLTASLFLRGVPVVQVPTTLLAMVDSSVGGKTAVNLPEGKNLVGTFHPPRLVVADVDFLASLSDDEFRSGLGEVVKMAIGVDASLFEYLEEHADPVLARDPEAMIEIVERSIAAKIRVVEDDMGESGPRRVLNLGHTWGHALEAHSGFAVPHGIAVARGMWVVLRLSQQRGHIDGPAADRTAALLDRYGYGETPIPADEELRPFLVRDKKVRDGALHLVLPTGVGTSTVVPVPLSDL